MKTILQKGARLTAVRVDDEATIRWYLDRGYRPLIKEDDMTSPIYEAAWKLRATHGLEAEPIHGDLEDNGFFLSGPAGELLNVGDGSQCIIAVTEVEPTNGKLVVGVYADWDAWDESDLDAAAGNCTVDEAVEYVGRILQLPGYSFGTCEFCGAVVADPDEPCDRSPDHGHHNRQIASRNQ